MERALIPTGLFISLPLGYEAQVRARSGLALKKGIGVLNAPGTIDADYRGEIGIKALSMGFKHTGSFKFARKSIPAEAIV